MVNMDIETVMKKHEARLRRLANVTGVGIGEKDGQQVILVFVSSKVAEEVLPPSEIVPKMLDGYATDVEIEVRVG